MTINDISETLVKPDQKLVIKDNKKNVYFEGNALELLDHSELDDRKIIGIRIDNDILKLTIR